MVKLPGTLAAPVPLTATESTAAVTKSVVDPTSVVWGPPGARGNKGSAILELVKHLEAANHVGQTTIFPQGTRVLPGAKEKYKVGAGVIYTRMEKECVPVATNVGVFWARRSPIRKPGTAVLEFLEPIAPGLELKEFMAKLENVIETNSDRLMVEAGYEFEK